MIDVSTGAKLRQFGNCCVVSTLYVFLCGMIRRGMVFFLCGMGLTGMFMGMVF